MDALHRTGQGGHDLLRLSVWKRKESTIQILKRRRIRHRLKRQIANLCQIWMHRVDALAGVFIRGDQPQIDLRVKQQDTQEFTPSVARSPYDSCFDHVLSLTFSTSNLLKSKCCTTF